MKELIDLVVVARVVERRSFAAAAVDLGVPSSTLSRRVSALERRLGVRVLERTTRTLRPTEIGELLAEHGRRIRAELDSADRMVADHQHAPRGVLRLSVPTPTATDLLGPTLAEYLRRYPDIRLEVTAEDRIVDLVAEGYDAAIRLAQLPDSSLGTIRLGTIRPVLAGGRAYLERAKPLRHPRDLREHAIVGFGAKRRQAWAFVRGGAEVTVDVAPRAASNNASLVAKLCAGGAGLSLIPRFTAIEAGLEVVEPGGWAPRPSDFSIVTPSPRALPPKLRALVDLMHEFVAARADVFDTVVPRKDSLRAPR